jgi:hypothetical protein
MDFLVGTGLCHTVRHKTADGKGEYSDFLRKLAPQAGFEPATLRLTGGKNVGSRLFAAVCRRLPDRASAQRKSNDFRLSLCAALCCRLPPLVSPKGQEKGNPIEWR